MELRKLGEQVLVLINKDMNIDIEGYTIESIHISEEGVSYSMQEGYTTFPAHRVYSTCREALDDLKLKVKNLEEYLVINNYKLD